MKKIAIVLGSLNVGGAEARMVDVLENIDKNSFHIDFILLSKESNQFFEERVLSHGANIFKLNSPRSVGVLHHVKELKDIFVANIYDVVHANTSYHSGIVVFAAKVANVPIRLVHARTDRLRNSDLKHKLSKNVGKILIELYSTKKLAISKNSADFLFLDKKHVVMVPDAINLDRFLNPLLSEKKTLIDQYNLKDKTIIGHVGRFDKAKNQKFVIKVFSLYHKINPNSILVLIGEGELMEKCKELAIDLDLKKQVLFLGVRSDVEVWMHVFGILIFPSIYEGLGNVAIEAQAAGLPCLCSKGVPRSIDLDLGIVKFMSLEKSISKWSICVEEMVSKRIYDKKLIKRKFNEKKFTMSHEIRLLSDMYQKG